MANGAAIHMAFVGRKTLERNYWGYIELASAAFYDKIVALASRAEGRDIKAVDGGVPHP